MKPFFLTCFLFLAFSASYAQNCLGYVWQIQRGDSVQWQKAGFVPHHWKRVNIGISLERQGYSCYSGYYSLWNQVVIPAEYKSSNGGRLQLRFQFDAKKADVFFNGQAIGSSRQPGSEEAFELPKEIIRWGQGNQVLVRIHNSFYTGGSCKTYIHIVPSHPKGGVALGVSYLNEQHVFEDPSSIHLSTFVQAQGGQSFTGVQKALVVSDFHDTVFVKQSQVLASDSKHATSYALGKLTPGFYQLQLSFSSNGIATQNISWFAVAPEKVVTKPMYQKEVLDFWGQAKKDLAAIEPRFRLVRKDSLCTEKNDVYIVEMQSLGNITVRGWYIVPLKPGIYPAVLHLQGYSVAMQPSWFMGDTDMIHLALDVRGHGLSADVIHPGFGTPGYVGYKVGDPEQYIYRGAYMDCSRAVDFLLSRPEVDTNRLAVEGHSQGGGMSLATAALKPKQIKYCVTGSPFLSDFAHHVQIRTVYGDEMNFYRQQDGISREQVYKTMNLVDIVNLAGLIQCPVLMGVGLFDDDCPPHINFASYNRIQSKKEYYILPNSSHLLGNEWRQYSNSWLRKMFQL